MELFSIRIQRTFQLVSTGVTEEFYVLHKTKSPFPLALIRITLVGLFQPLGFTSIK